MRANHVITLHDFSRPLAARKAARKHCGPYTWTVPALDTKAEGRGFYFDRHGGIGDATFYLRIAPANDFLRGRRIAHINGYFADDFQDSTIYPYVVSLPHGRGFMPAYGEGPGMWGTVDYDLFDNAEDAAIAAHSAAERAAEREREFRAAEYAEEMADAE